MLGSITECAQHIAGTARNCARMACSASGRSASLRTPCSSCAWALCPSPCTAPMAATLLPTMAARLMDACVVPAICRRPLERCAYPSSSGCLLTKPSKIGLSVSVSNFMFKPAEVAGYADLPAERQTARCSNEYGRHQGVLPVCSRPRLMRPARVGRALWRCWKRPQCPAAPSAMRSSGCMAPTKSSCAGVLPPKES